MCLATVINCKIKALTLSRFYVSLKWLSTRCTESQFKNVFNNSFFEAKIFWKFRCCYVILWFHMQSQCENNQLKPWEELLTHSVLYSFDQVAYHRFLWCYQKLIFSFIVSSKLFSYMQTVDSIDFYLLYFWSHNNIVRNKHILNTVN